MRRSILTSLVLIGAAVAVVIGSGTFAEFTDSESIDGDVQAGYLGIAINQGDNEVDDELVDEDLIIDWDDSANGCFDFFAPGDNCVVTIGVSRGAPEGADFTSQLAADLSIANLMIDGQSVAWTFNTGSAATEVDCTNPEGVDSDIGDDDHFTITVSGFTDGDGGTNGFMPAGADDSESFTITVDFPEGADNSCQGEGPIAITMDVDATQASDPHQTTE